MKSLERRRVGEVWILKRWHSEAIGKKGEISGYWSKRHSGKLVIEARNHRRSARRGRAENFSFVACYPHTSEPLI